jgi:hypothetical protein
MIDRTLERVDTMSLENVSTDELIFEFPRKVPHAKSCLVLKDPKSDDSIRKLYLTKRLRDEFLARKEKVERDKAYYGSDYHDYNLVFCLPNGDPVEPRLIEKWFINWQAGCGLDLPAIDFHSLRHTSTSYLLRLSGDLMAVAKNNGHSDPDTTLIYAHEHEESLISLMQMAEDDFWDDRQATNKLKSTAAERKNSGTPPYEEIIAYAVENNLRAPSAFGSSNEYFEYVIENMRAAVSKKTRANAFPADGAQPAGLA